MTATAYKTDALQAFAADAGWGDATFHPLKGDASFRRYIRLRRGAESAMLMDAPPEKEDVRPYLSIATHLEQAGYSAPRILARDVEKGFLLLEDLGDDLFTPLLAHGRAGEDALYDAAIDLLARWHTDASLQKPTSGLALRDYDRAELLREAALFSDWFLPAALGPRAEDLRADYLAQWEKLFTLHPLAPHLFVHRDYHADNLLWLPQRAGAAQVGLLDFQDALWGHAAYDLASLLEDARRDVPPELAARQIARYLSATGQDAQDFAAAYALLAAQRNSKIIGIFTRLSRRDGKHHYLHFLPRVWAHLERDLAHPLLADLREWTDRHVPRSARGELPHG